MAKFCSAHICDVVKGTEAFKEGDLGLSLKQTFLKMDDMLRTPAGQVRTMPYFFLSGPSFLPCLPYPVLAPSYCLPLLPSLVLWVARLDAFTLASMCRACWSLSLSPSLMSTSLAAAFSPQPHGTFCCPSANYRLRGAAALSLAAAHLGSSTDDHDHDHALLRAWRFLSTPLSVSACLCLSSVTCQ